MTRWLIAALLLITHWELYAAQCSAVFTDGASTHSSNGTITFQRNAQIIGSNGTLDFTSIRDLSGGNSCFTQACAISGSSAADLDLETFRESSSSNDITINRNQSRSLTAGEYDDVEVGQGGALTFTTEGGTYLMETLSLGRNAIGNFAPGDYWIEDLTLEQGSRITLTGSGVVRIFVDDVIINRNANINNPGDSERLALIAYDDVDIEQGASVVGAVYASDRVTLQRNSRITGAVSARTVSLAQGSAITYESSATTNATLGNVCDADTVDQLYANYLFDEASWSGANPVIDNSGNGRNAETVGDVTPLLLETCSVLDVPRNTSRRVQDAIDTNIDLNDVGDKGTISFWYRSNAAWSSGTARQLFDASNEAPQPDKYFYLSLERGVLEFGAEDESDSDFFLQMSGLTFAPEQWVHIAVTWNVAANQLQMFVNSQGVSRVVSRTQGNFNVTLGDLDTLYIGDNRSNYLVSNGTGNSANGQFDDFRIYNYVRTSGQVLSEATNEPVCGSVTPYAFYQFEEPEWNSAGDVLDSGDNGRHGTALGIAGSAFPEVPLSCRVLDVPVNSDVAIMEGVDTRIDMNDVGERGTISFWYRSNEDWNNATPRQLFDATNTSNDKYFYLNLQAGTLQFGLEDDTDDDARLTESGFSYAAGTWVHIAVTWDVYSDVMEIYLNGTRVARDDNIGLRSTTLGDMETLLLGDNRSDYLVSNGSPNSANGQFDDVRIYRGVQEQQEIADDMADLSPCSFVHHYRITHPGTALTCEVANINVRACVDAACNVVYDQQSVVTVNPFAETLTIPANATNGVNVDVRQTTIGTQTLTVVNDLPAAENAPICVTGGGNSCQIEFVNAGFDIYGANVGDGIADQLAETLFSGVNIRAVQDTDGVCVPALGNESVDVTFTHACTSPASCRTFLEYDGVALNRQPVINVSFDADGTANLPLFQYNDAGQISLSANTTLDDGTVIESGSELIQVYPASLDISGTQATTNHNAGADFLLEIKALGAKDGVLPNYIPGNLQFQLTSLIGPEQGRLTYADGQTHGSETDTSFRDVTISSSSFANNNGVYQYQANYSEVDQLSFNVRDNNYAGYVITNGGDAETLGLFIPAYFDVTATSTPTFANTCEADSPVPVFTYLGEPFGFATPAGAGEDPQFNLTARNANGAITLNYRDNYWNWLPNAAELNNITFSDTRNPSGVTLVANSATAIAADINNGGVEYGRQRLTISNMQVIYNKPALPVNPVESDATMVLPANLLSDNTYGGNTVCVISGYDKLNPGACENVTTENIAGADLRWGRILMENAFGPENEDLLVTVKTEYFDDFTFIRNRDDQCTSFNWSALNFSKEDFSVEVGYTDITGEVVVSTLDEFTLLDGITQGLEGITVTAPEVRGELRIELLPDGNWDRYLQFDWEDEDDEKSRPNPTAIVTFGQFRGNERIIHWREVF